MSSTNERRATFEIALGSDTKTSSRSERSQFAVLVIGDFAAGSVEREPRVLSIDADNFEQVLARIQPRIPLSVVDGELSISPRLPPRWEALEFTVVYRGERLRVRATRSGTTISADGDNSTDVALRVDGSPIVVSPGESIKIDS